MAKATGKDQRTAERRGLKAAVVYTPSVGVRKKERSHSAVTVNVSDGGVCLRTEMVLVPAQIVRLTLPVKGGHAASPTLAEVCWVRGEAGGYQIGFRFLL